MRADLVSALRCPVCAGGLELSGRTARCPRGHAFDLARQGYLNLAPPVTTGIDGDSAEMVDARATFLGQGWYEPIRAAVVESLPPVASGGERPLAVEVGAGTAYYLAGVVCAGWRGIATDVSRYAARRAARTDPAIGSVVCDAWREIPVRDGAAAVVLDVFAPRNASEMARILVPGGTLIVVTPQPEHLAELVEVLGLVRVDEDKPRRVAAALAGFEQIGSRGVEATLRLGHDSVGELVAMTPSARHLDAAARAERIGALPETVEVTLAVTVSRWQVGPA